MELSVWCWFFDGDLGTILNNKAIDKLTYMQDVNKFKVLEVKKVEMISMIKVID